jgi:hypothetical protein
MSLTLSLSSRTVSLTLSLSLVAPCLSRSLSRGWARTHRRGQAVRARGVQQGRAGHHAALFGPRGDARRHTGRGPAGARARIPLASLASSSARPAPNAERLMIHQVIQQLQVHALGVELYRLARPRHALTSWAGVTTHPLDDCGPRSDAHYESCYGAGWSSVISSTLRSREYPLSPRRLHSCRS